MTIPSSCSPWLGIDNLRFRAAMDEALAPGTIKLCATNSMAYSIRPRVLR
jgi:hypothetical protein